MPVILFSDFRDLIESCAVLFHVLTACICKKSYSVRTIVWSSQLVVMRDEFVKRVNPVCEERLERSFVHLLEAKCENTLRRPASDCPRGHVNPGTACSPIVIDIKDGNTGVAALVDGSLARARVTVDVGRVGLLQLLKSDSSVS